MTIDIESRTARSPEKTRKSKTVSAAEASVTPPPPRMPGRRNPKWIALGIVAFLLLALWAVPPWLVVILGALAASIVAML